MASIEPKPVCSCMDFKTMDFLVDELKVRKIELVSDKFRAQELLKGLPSSQKRDNIESNIPILTKEIDEIDEMVERLEVTPSC